MRMHNKDMEERWYEERKTIFSDDESIRLSRLTLDEITEKIVKGEINDAKTMGMTFLIKEFKERNQ